MSMREQMARAIFMVTHSHSDWDSILFRTDRADSFAQADAALDALMEPTEGMVESFDCYVANTSGCQCGLDSRGAYSAMIRAAKDGK